jgi:GH15 family glucan-1,4-alpha-glucosidase
MNMGFEGPRVTGRTLLKEGDTMFVALSWSEHPGPTTYEEAYDRLVWTAHHWQHWLDHGAFPDHPWRTALQRSALTLKGLSYAPTGALVAAATTSLPESPGGERNWDYRFTWIRDATFMLWGLYTLGFDWEANDFFYFIADVAESEQNTLQIMYGIDGEDQLEEHTLDHLSGYEGARPVRTGNAAYDQEQHDVWGALLDSVYLHTKSRDHLPERIWPILKRQVEAAIENWREPDRGIWEIRGDPQHHVHSKLMAWLALDRALRIADTHRLSKRRRRRWRTERDAIAEQVRRDGFSDSRNSYTRSYGSDELDASVLVLPLLGLEQSDGPRVRDTIDAIQRDLGAGGPLLYRYPPGSDGLPGTEGAFLPCAFWLVQALAKTGRVDEAAERFRALLQFATPLGLYAEEMDPVSHEHLGNFPQALSHAALVQAALALRDAAS